MAREIARYASTESDIAKAIELCKDNGITQVYIETFRNGFTGDKEQLSLARDRFRSAGFEVAGAVCTNRYGVPGTTLTEYPCLTRRKTQAQLEEVFGYTAGIFDLVLIDEYLWSHCQCDECKRAKGNDSWTEFRCRQMVDACRQHVIEPSRRVNPRVTLLYKFPAMYEQFTRQGQDAGRLSRIFDGVWAGSEVGPFGESPQGMLRSQGAYRAYVIMSWLTAVAKSQLGGSWIMPLEDTSYLIDSAYQTILGRPGEIVLHPFGGLSTEYGWVFPGGQHQFQKLLADLEGLVRLKAIADANPPRGLLAARPIHAEPHISGKAYDANIFDFLGLVGIPVVMSSRLTGEAEGYFLSLHARSAEGFKEVIATLNTSPKPVLLTDGLASVLDDSLLHGPNVHVLHASIPMPTLYDYRSVPDPYDLRLARTPVPYPDAWKALDDDTGWDVSMRYNCDPLMAARVFSHVLDLHPKFRQDRGAGAQTILQDIRDTVLGAFGIHFEAPMYVSIHPLGARHVCLHNMNERSIEAVVRSSAGPNAFVEVNLPSANTVTVNREATGHRVRLGPHTLVCLRFTA